MSQFTVKNEDGSRYQYGYDRVLQYYFLSVIDAEGDVEHIVGLLSCPEVYGSASNLLEQMEKFQIPMPKEHFNALICDLPFDEVYGTERVVLTVTEAGHHQVHEFNIVDGKEGDCWIWIRQHSEL